MGMWFQAIICDKTESVNKNINKCLSPMYFSTSVWLIITDWKRHFTFYLCETNTMLLLSGVFGCLSVQHETGAVFAPSGDKGTALITISESEYESEGDLITPPTSQHGWLPSV